MQDVLPAFHKVHKLTYGIRSRTGVHVLCLHSSAISTGVTLGATAATSEDHVLTAFTRMKVPQEVQNNETRVPPTTWPIKEIIKALDVPYAAHMGHAQYKKEHTWHEVPHSTY